MQDDLRRRVEGFIVEHVLLELGTIRAALDARAMGGASFSLAGTELDLLRARITGLEQLAQAVSRIIAEASDAETADRDLTARPVAMFRSRQN